MVGVVKCRFWYAGVESLFCYVTDPDLLAAGIESFIAEPHQCIGYLGPENKIRPIKPIIEIDFKPEERVQSKVGG